MRVVSLHAQATDLEWRTVAWGSGVQSACGLGNAHVWCVAVGVEPAGRKARAPAASNPRRAMVSTRSLAVFLVALLALAAAAPPAPLHRQRRQLADDDALQPLQDAEGDEQAREKRKLEGATQAKFGIKNAVLGFVFGKINSLIDAKTRFVESLDRQNIELNKQYGIEPPSSGGLASLSGVVGQVIGPKLQLLGPKIQAVTGLLGGASGGSGGSGGSGLGSILSLVTSLSGSSSGGGGGTVETVDSSEEDSS
ncbi:uncharacterized protein LOC115440955 isoform X1 [Manduca sexta]|uniref:Uncharacterized protein n=1 Tax=Manduca sexta TaxID=7130 RepID=A0A922CHD3_MANSE|nr:uncharacterized protein LOC115440955 isoform X1 [Manduca sexta]KAG6446196.1 hypothetical protein O3G_MSEX004300 [Manduca sexta]